jgi:hypothetical protein
MTEELIIPKMPKTVHIIGCGPSAAGHLDDGEFAIALNAAILHPREWDIFAAFDLGVMDELWWNPQRILERAKIMALGVNFKNQGGPRIWKFNYRRSLAHARNNLSREPISKEHPLESYNPVVKTALRGSCSIAGCMLQATALAGVKEVYLIGVDMRGTAHTIGRPPSGGKEGDWDILNRMRRLVACLERDYKMKIHWNRKEK